MFYSSRNSALQADLKTALLRPLSPDGGLYCLKNLRPFANAQALANRPYDEVAQAVFAQLGFGEFAAEFAYSLGAYESFDNGRALERKSLLGREILELFHGRTRAFKDLALAPLARLLSRLAGGQKLLINCATSGDTGPATLAAFDGLARTVCIYPEGKTSAAQRAQMVSQRYKNALVLGINGNFDDAQSALKELLNDNDFQNLCAQKGYVLGAANSLNFGRIIYQIIYHFYAAINAAAARAQNLCIPSGNFGNALAAFYAKKLGAPIGKIKVISNENRVLADFFATGCYDLRGREFKLTASPAMDILKSSNLERLLAHFLGCERTKECYESLTAQGFFALSAAELALLSQDFEAHSCSDEQCLKTIASVHAQSGRLLCPHTACAFAYAAPGEVVAATAEWCKFAPTIARALGEPLGDEGDFIAARGGQSELVALIKSGENFAQNCESKQIKERIIAWL